MSSLKGEAGQLYATDLTPYSLTWLSWRRGHLDRWVCLVAGDTL